MLIAIGLGLSVLLLNPQRSLNSFFLATALLLMSIVEGADLFALRRPELWLSAKSFATVFESLLGTAWFLFAVTFARKKPFHNLSPFSWAMLACSLILPVVAFRSPPELFFYSPDFIEEQILFLGQSSYLFYIGILFLTVAALYQLERTLVSFSATERSMALFEIVGIGLILVAMLVYYSQALFHRTIDMNLVPARALAFLAGACLFAYSRFKGANTRGIIVSRTVATQSVVVLAVGCYLFSLGGLGEGLRYFGLQDLHLPYIGFAVISGLGLALLLLSEKYRRKLNVFLYKHFYRQKYDYRNEWLMFTAQLSSAENLENVQNAILAFYCETFGRKSASLYLLDQESGTYQLKSDRYLEFPEVCFLKDHPLLTYLNETNFVFNTGDQHSSEFDKIKLQFETFKVELCVPLKHEQNLEGFILIGEAINTEDRLIFEDYDLMKVLARQATSVLLTLKLSAQLSTAQEMATIGKLSAFIIHDLKNHVSNLTLMVDNAREHISNPEFQTDMIETMDETINKVNTLIERLKNIKEKMSLHLKPCDLREIVRRGVKASGHHPKLGQTEKVLAYVDAKEIEKVVHNLVLNAYEAGTQNGPVTINVGFADTAFFEVADQGVGMSDDFIRNRLYQPFQTTKERGLGIGLYQCRQIIEAHGGKIEVSSKEGVGTSFKVHLPAATN
jgi:putative PEP-CTERM system histidine kinase